MKINEVEARVGITKKNIRFYEKEGLLCPRRNSENGYREYGPEEVECLMRIKLMRKLGLPLEEIRRMQAGACTVGDAMRRHLVTLERERQNLEQAIALCAGLQNIQKPLDELDAGQVLERMEEMERGGTMFKNKQKQDVRRRYLAPAIAAVVMVVLMGAVAALLVWAYMTEPEEAPPIAVMAALLLMPLVVIVGVLMALRQRWGELKRGEEDEAKQY